MKAANIRLLPRACERCTTTFEPPARGRRLCDACLTIPAHRRRKTPKAPELPEVAYDRHLRRTYGLRLADYDAMFALQRGLCAICGQPEKAPTGINGSTTVRRLAIDHDHKLGGIRALLCSACNQGLGCFQHDPWLLEQAAKYLGTHESESAWTLGGL